MDNYCWGDLREDCSDGRGRGDVAGVVGDLGESVAGCLQV